MTNNPVNFVDPYGLEGNGLGEFGDVIFRNTTRTIRRWISNNGDKVSPHIAKVLFKADGFRSRMKRISSNKHISKWQKASLQFMNAQDLALSYYLVGKAGSQGWFIGSKMSPAWGYGLGLTFAELMALFIDKIDGGYDIEIWMDLYEKFNELNIKEGSNCEN